MKSYYTIGETAKLLGVTPQTLRHYEKIGILNPRKIDEHTGYRYYSFDQFHIIDRIKYLQGLGLHLNDIGQIIKKGDRCRPSACPGKRMAEILSGTGTDSEPHQRYRMVHRIFYLSQ